MNNSRNIWENKMSNAAFFENSFFLQVWSSSVQWLNSIWIPKWFLLTSYSLAPVQLLKLLLCELSVIATLFILPRLPQQPRTHTHSESLRRSTHDHRQNHFVLVWTTTFQQRVIMLNLTAVPPWMLNTAFTSSLVQITVQLKMTPQFI